MPNQWEGGCHCKSCSAAWKSTENRNNRNKDKIFRQRCNPLPCTVSLRSCKLWTSWPSGIYLFTLVWIVNKWKPLADESSKTTDCRFLRIFKQLYELAITRLFWEKDVPLDTQYGDRPTRGQNILHTSADACPKYQRLVCKLFEISVWFLPYVLRLVFFLPWLFPYKTGIQFINLALPFMQSEAVKVQILEMTNDEGLSTMEIMKINAPKNFIH